jgi:hypothetical protein
MSENKNEIAVRSENIGAMQPWVEGSVYEKISSLADKFSKSDMCPTQFKDKPTEVFIALQLANRMQIDPFLAIQNMNIVRGKPSWAAPFAIALANERGPFATKIRFETKGSGDQLAVTASATLKDSGEIASATVSMAMAVAEGWVSKNTKYKTMPEQMLCYRSAGFLIRRYCPEVLVGMPTDDEVMDVARPTSPAGSSAARDVSPAAAATKRDEINKSIKEAKNEQTKKPIKNYAPGAETNPEPEQSTGGEYDEALI